MNIGVFCARLSGNGPRVRTRTLLESLAETDHHVRLVTGPDEPVPDGIETYPVVEPTAKGLARAAVTVRRVFRHADLVYVPVNWRQVAFVRALYRGPLVVGPGVKHDYLHRGLARWLAPDHVIDTHPFVAWLWDVSGFDATPVYWGVDTDRFTPEAEGRYVLDGGENGRPTLLFVGALSAFKGGDLFLGLTDRLPAARFVACGDGPLRDHFEAHPRVTYDGFVPNADLPAYYRAADVVVAPSRTESGLGVGYEAIACGTPVVTTCRGAAEWLYRDRGTYVWADRTVEAIESAVRRLLDDPAFYAAQVERGFDTIDEFGLSAEAMADRTLAVFEAVAE